MQSEPAVLVSWSHGIGDTRKSHIVHVDPEGLTWAVGISDPKDFEHLTAEAAARPAEAAALIAAHKRGRRLPRERLARVTYAKGLNQLTIFDDAGKKQHIEYGKGVQAQIFEAANRYFGGTASEEEADAWSIMKVPLFALAVTAVIGGFFIYGAATADPNYVASGRRAGMKQMMESALLYIGPTWMSVIVGVIALLCLAPMVLLLIARPKRQVLTF
jgi:hypothetical protein